MEVDLNGHTLTIDDTRVNGDAQRFLQRYLNGERITFDGAVDLADLTPFQQEVVRAIRDVPYGETSTYGELAERLGKRNAARAVANACGANPCSVIIPCHRIVARDGLGGYSDGGQAVKAWLLQHEHADVSCTTAGF